MAKVRVSQRAPRYMQRKTLTRNGIVPSAGVLMAVSRILNHCEAVRKKVHFYKALDLGAIPANTTSGTKVWWRFSQAKDANLH